VLKFLKGKYMFKFSLHAIVKDKVTGFTGVILGRTDYATGCLQYGVLSQKLAKDGKPSEWVWFDETRLILTGKKIQPLTKIGGPSPLAPSI
jgi:hypothetical protein